MLVQFDFTLLQLSYIHAAMTEVPSYRPDGSTLGEVATQIVEAEGFHSEYVNSGNEADGARVRRRVSNEQLHDLCVDFRAQAKSRFRKDESLGQRLNRLPVDDRTFGEAMKRADLIVALWADLAPFTVGQGTENVSSPRCAMPRGRWNRNWWPPIRLSKRRKLRCGSIELGSPIS